MAALLVNTRSGSLLDLLGNGHSYSVPPFQREYSWREEQWEDLWADIASVRDDENSRHYMGAIVLTPESDRRDRIIDGQQRLATLSILGLAVIERLKTLAAEGVDAERNEERAKALRDRFIGDKDPASLVWNSKLDLNDADNGFYQEYLVQLRDHPNARGLPRSNRLMRDCHRFFREAIASDEALGNSGERIAALLSDVISRRLYFIIISVDDDLNAYTVFETLNARGIELSSTDLLKNHLFSRVKTKADLSSLQRRWRSVLDVVTQEAFPEFLRYHLQCTHKKVRAQRVFKIIRDEVRTPEAVMDLMNVLEARAEVFAALRDPTHEYWMERPECREWVRELRLLNVSQMTPLLFAAWEHMNGQFDAILRMVAVISVRYTTVGNRNPNELERPYHNAARAILEGSARTPAAVFEYLAEIYVSDASFERDLSYLEIRARGPQKKIAKYLLSRLESHEARRAVDFETDSGTIEHILPEKPDASWSNAFSTNQQTSLVHRLGNLALLEPAINREIGNKPFAVKKARFTESRYASTRALGDDGPDEWTPFAIESRQRDLAKSAIAVWRLDYPPRRTPLASSDSDEETL